jgi:hypothetical protein
MLSLKRGRDELVNKILGSLVLVVWASVSVEASAQNVQKQWTIHCADSKITVPAGLSCTTAQMSGGQSGWSADAGGTSRQWNAIGTVNGVEYGYWLIEATSFGEGFNPAVTLQAGIRIEMARGNETRNFSALTNRGGADFMTFTDADGDSCVAIRRYGPSQGGGYKWILNAVRCETNGRPTTDSDISSFIAGATVRGS